MAAKVPAAVTTTEVLLSVVVWPAEFRSLIVNPVVTTWPGRLACIGCEHQAVKRGA